LIYVTGDIHGDDSITKLGAKRFPEGRSLTKDDLVIILGDFGLFWDPAMPRRDTYWLDWLDSKPWTTAFIDGNHENHEMLKAMPYEIRFGGLVGVHPKWSSVVYLRRGQTYILPDGVTAFCMGGASSHDIKWRTEGKSWWSDELPSEEDFAVARKSLDACDWHVDYVFTHDCPSSVKQRLLSTWNDADDVSERIENDRLNDFLDEIDGRLRYGRWFFGHYHVDEEIDDRHVAMYHDILAISQTDESV